VYKTRVTVLILEQTTSATTHTHYVDIGGLSPYDVLTLAANLNRRYTLVGTVSGRWEREPKDLREIFPLIMVTASNLWRYAEAPYQLKMALVRIWESELQTAEGPWASLLRPKLVTVRKTLIDGARPEDVRTRFDMIG